MPEEYLRKASYSDMELLFKWANDPETRANSINSDPISFDGHKRWFNEKINHPNVLFYIYHNGNQDIGQVRFDIVDDTAEISYSVAASFRGQGYGQRMMLLAENEVKNNYPNIKWLQASVKNGNMPSYNIFKKLGYVELAKSNLILFLKKNLANG
jgi:RimJ/RimL family protein N-acetyltransferase